MDYNALLELSTDIGHRLAMCGAETFRVEDSINLIMQAYGIQAETFAIPNNMTVSIETPAGELITRMRRIGLHGTDLDAVERYTNLSRRICREKPDLETAQLWLKETESSLLKYNLFGQLAGHFLGAAGFSVFFGGTFPDMLFAGLCGMIVGIISILLDKVNTNHFFRTIIASFCMAVVAYLLGVAGVVKNPDTVIIGTLMSLVPGLLFTNAMRDIIYGDTNSGINRIVQVFLIAVAIVLGTAAAWSVIAQLIHAPVGIDDINHHAIVQLLACAVGCVGFTIIFNIHGPGGLLCILGGAIAWASYMVVFHFSGDDLGAYFWAAIISSLYSEIMARVRKYPAISYLVVSLFPLIPGASVYYTMNYAVRGDMASFASYLMHTAAIAGVLAVGVLLISTLFRMHTTWKRSKTTK